MAFKLKRSNEGPFSAETLEELRDFRERHERIQGALRGLNADHGNASKAAKQAEDRLTDVAVKVRLGELPEAELERAQSEAVGAELRTRGADGAARELRRRMDRLTEELPAIRDALVAQLAGFVDAKQAEVAKELDAWAAAALAPLRALDIDRAGTSLVQQIEQAVPLLRRLGQAVRLAHHDNTRSIARVTLPDGTDVPQDHPAAEAHQRTLVDAARHAPLAPIRPRPGVVGMVER